MTEVLCATDLDRTLIYSHGALGDDPPPLVPVEQHEGRSASWLTAPAADMFTALQQQAVVVPVTTRTPEQWARVRLPGVPPRYAVTANGGVLLVDGHVDHGWDAVVAAGLREVAPLAEIWSYASRACRPEWTVKLRNARGLFCYAVLHRRRVPPGFFAETAGWAAQRGWRQSVQGRKIYWVPRSLTKSAAVAEVARRAGCDRVLAAGDSLLDVDLLEAAERGIVARHGELVASGWQASTVTVSRHSGVRAGEDIVGWFAQTVSDCGGDAPR